jgi:HAE1 family hydrophobic/amphiphilic exporter-1
VVTEVENALKILIAPDRAAVIWGDQILPSDDRTIAPPEASDLRELVALAIKKRRELQQLGMRRDVNDIQKQFNADQIKPQVNLVGSYSNNGIGGSLRPGENPLTASNVQLYERLNALSTIAGLPPVVPAGFGGIPDYLVGGYGSALSNVFSGRYQSVQVGIQFDLNLRNQTAKANLAQTAIAERRLKLEGTRLEQAIEAQVRNALQGLETARQRIAAATAGEKAAQEKLESEIRLFQTGESTNFLVLTRQNDYLDARRRSVLAALEFNRSVARIEQSVGNTLQSYNITLK